MKKILSLIAAVAFVSGAAFAGNVTVLPVKADASYESFLPTVEMISKSAFSAAAQNSSADFGDAQVQITLMPLGSQVMLNAEVIVGGETKASSQQKAASMETIDEAITAAASALFPAAQASSVGSLNDANYAAQPAPAPAPVQQEPVQAQAAPANDDAAYAAQRAENERVLSKSRTAAFGTFRLGGGYWHDFDGEGQASLNVTWGRLWEVTAHGGVTLLTQLVMPINWSDDGFWQHFITIGGRYYFTTNDTAPYVGGGIGLGYSYNGYRSRNNWAWGLPLTGYAGTVLFRSSSIQLDIALTYSVLWDIDGWVNPNASAGLQLGLNY